MPKPKRRCACGCRQVLPHDTGPLLPGHVVSGPLPATAAEIREGLIVMHDPDGGMTWLDSGRRMDIRLCRCQPCPAALRRLGPHFRLAAGRTWESPT